MSFCVVLIYREHVSRLLRQDRRHVRDTDVEWNGDAKDASVCFPTVDAVVRGRADVQYVPAVDDDAAQSHGGP